MASSLRSFHPKSLGVSANSPKSFLEKKKNATSHKISQINYLMSHDLSAQFHLEKNPKNLQLRSHVQQNQHPFGLVRFRTFC